jgi:hypothetical protein
MKSKKRIKKESPKPVPQKGEKAVNIPGEDKLPAVPVQNDPKQVPDTEDDLSKEEVKGLEEALKNADRGEPVTLKEFKKMAKKWSSK